MDSQPQQRLYGANPQDAEVTDDGNFWCYFSFHVFKKKKYSLTTKDFYTVKLTKSLTRVSVTFQTH